MPFYPLTNSKKQKYYQNKPKFNAAYSRNNLPKIKDGAYVINLDEFKSRGTHWVALYVNDESESYFDRFELEHVPKEIRKFIKDTDVKMIIYRIQAHVSIMGGYFCIGFIYFMLKSKYLLDYTNLSSPSD